MALRLPAGTYGSSFCRDRLTEARAHRANALRAQGELPRAEALLEQVAARLRDAFDPFLLAEVASFAAALAKDQRRFGEAHARLDQAESLFEEVEAGFGLLARFRLQRASLFSLDGDLEPAAEIAAGVIESLPEKVDPELAFTARHDLVSDFCEAERYEEARNVLTELAALSQDLPTTLP